MQFVLFLPQMRLTAAAIVERARVAEAAGFHGIAFMDHLEPPLAERQPMFEAFSVATWVAAHTTTLHVSHLVLCDAFRHPAVLARQAASLQAMSAGRFELGIGSGSWPDEFARFGIQPDSARDRTTRLGETLAVLRALWSNGTSDGIPGESFSYEGSHHRLAAAVQRPLPDPPIPIVIGGTGPRTMDLVATYAQWWNLPVHRLDRLDALRASAGDARISIQQMIGFVADPAQRDAVEGVARSRFGYQRDLLVGDRHQVLARVEELRAQGVERFYVWFTDFADPRTLEAFGVDVINASERKDFRP